MTTSRDRSCLAVRCLTDSRALETVVLLPWMLRRLIVFVVLASATIVGQTDEKVYRVGGAVSAPKIVSKVEPEYTEEALAARRQGYVLIELVIASDGASRDIHEIGQRLGSGLDERAIEAVKQWRFKPGEKSGQPVSVSVQISVSFRLPR
jgi:TonB family protein